MSICYFYIWKYNFFSKVKKDQLLHQDPESYSKSPRLAIRKSLSPLILKGQGIATLWKQSTSRVLSRAIN